MALPQEIVPFHQDVQDALFSAGKADWVEYVPDQAWARILWTGSESGTWAVIFKWAKGFIATPHKHLAGSHTYIISGKLKVREGILDTGDYVYEPNGVLHDFTEALEDTEYLFICNGPLIFFDDSSFTGYIGWEEMEKWRQNAAPTPEEASQRRLATAAE